MKETLLVFLFCCVVTNLCSQDLAQLQNRKDPFGNNLLKSQDSSKKLKKIVGSIFDVEYDTSRISDLSDRLNIYTGTVGKFHGIELNNSTINRKLKFEPNNKTSFGLGFRYKWIGLGINYSPGFINIDNDTYGNTQSFDTQLNIFTNTFGIDAYLQYYNGFYLKNPDHFMDWQTTSFPLRPELESYSFGLSAYYFTNNKRFSYKAAFTRALIQKKSAGSLILGSYVNVNTVNAPNGLIPNELPDSLISFFNIEAYKTGSLGLSVGYTYTLVFLKQFFINASLVPGLGIRSAEFRTNKITSRQEALLTGSLTTRIALGYEGKNIYAGLKIFSFIDTYNYESFDISSTGGNISLYFGKRFNVNHLFKKKKT